jgi:hypothetical protein
LIGGSTRTAHADIAMVTEDNEAERRANIWLQDLWAGRESAEFALPPSRLSLSLGDVAGLTVNGRRRLIEIQQISDTESRAVQALSIDPEVFDLALAPPSRRLIAPPPAIGPVHAQVLDLPTLTSELPPVLSRLAVFADPWPGTEAVWTSSDSVTYQRTALAVAPAVSGETLDDLPAGPTARWHNASFRVQLYGGVLSSASDLAVLNGANAAAVQRADGAWEVIQFANAVLTGDRTYTLSRLLRGQAGSERAMGAPLLPGAPFVLLDANIVTLASGLDKLERDLQVRVVAANRDYGDATVFALETVPQATALRPLTPVHVKAVRGTDGVAFNWIRRTRIDGDSWVGEVPLGEDSEQYTLDILSGTSIVRTLNATTPNALYAAADEIADFGAPQTSISVLVTQLSATVGAGFSATATLQP